MKIKNSTNYSDTFIRRMVSWCCQEIGLPVRAIRRAQFTNTAYACRGRAWRSMRILVRIGPESAFPQTEWKYKGNTVCCMKDRTMGLVGVTAHELFHLSQWLDGARRFRDRPEAGAVWAENMVVSKFETNREALLTEWSKEVAPANVIRIEPWLKRADKANRDLDRWQRKLKLAQTKIRKLRQRVRYYDSRKAAMGK